MAGANLLEHIPTSAIVPGDTRMCKDGFLRERMIHLSKNVSEIKLSLPKSNPLITCASKLSANYDAVQDKEDKPTHQHVYKKI